MIDRHEIILRALSSLVVGEAAKKKMSALERRYAASKVRFEAEQDRLYNAAVELYAKNASGRQAPGRPPGSRANDDADYSAALIAKMHMCGDDPTAKNKAIRFGIAFARSAGQLPPPSPMVSEASVQRRIARFLDREDDMLAQVLALQGYPT
jgi:hypothetical protein